jgi:hypothetical protein
VVNTDRVAIEDLEAEIARGTAKFALKSSMVENHGICQPMRLRNASISSTGARERKTSAVSHV